MSICRPLFAAKWCIFWLKMPVFMPFWAFSSKYDIFNIVSCAGKYNVSAKEINLALAQQHHYESSSFEREVMWRIAKSCCSQLWHLCEDSEALGGQFLSNKKASLKGCLSTESIFPAQLSSFA